MEHEVPPTVRPDVDPSPWMNDRLAEETMSDIVDYYTHHSPHLINKRLHELHTTWDLERCVQFISSVVGLMGLMFAAWHSMIWLFIPGLAFLSILQHAVYGKYLTEPFLRRLGYRPLKEINLEIQSLKEARGDFDFVRNIKSSGGKERTPFPK